MKSISAAEVAKHTTAEDLWLTIDSKVYDVTDFLDAHPGGAAALLNANVAGKDATEQFYNLHRHAVLQKYSHLQIGQIEGQTPKVHDPQPGDLSLVPHGEPTWLTDGFTSPYLTDSHRKFQKVVRAWVEEHIFPEADEHEVSEEKASDELVTAMGKEGVNINLMRLGPGKHLHGHALLGGVKPEEYDYFHEMILVQELARFAQPNRGFSDGLLSGYTISVPPVMNYMGNNPKLRDHVVEETMRGRKWIALAITEAFAGSDVSGIQTTAEKTADGKFYKLNGHKKWITNGHFASWFVTAARTGPKSLSLILVPRTEGVETKSIRTSYSKAAGTAYVTFDNALVPVENVIGKEGDGLKAVLSSFNHERVWMAWGSIRVSRLITEDCLKWAMQRKAFGKRLIDQPVIRTDLARMIALCEAAQAWGEQVAEQMCSMSFQQQNQKLAGRISLLKMYATQTEAEISKRAVQIFGGRALTKSGMGNKIEAHMRTLAFNAILGGAENILGDLGVRLAIKQYPESAKL
ncbi:hypothetical protein PYCC9005_004643 [Savitreella phatthalungensis]